VRCVYYPGTNTSGGNVGEVTDPVAGETYQLVCFDAANNVVYSAAVVYQPAVPAVSPGTLARQAWKTLPLVYPGAHTSPEATAPQYVGVSTWLWVDPAQWQPMTATAAIPGLSATVTATPSRSEWDLGDGTDAVECAAGTPYDQGRPAAEQSTDCSHTFERASSTTSDGVFHASVTVWWSVTWQATDGETGTLPDAFRTSTIDLRVGEIEALREAQAG
jgi:hypothetical protein